MYDSRGINVTRMNVNEAIYEALFASQLQPSDALTAEAVAHAIGSTVRRLGTAGCSCYLAEEFGNHPEQAADRMRWIRQLTGDLNGCLYFPTSQSDSSLASAAAGMLPVREAA
jgi:hypothetical protein